MNTQTLLHIFYTGVGLLETDNEDSIEIGTMLPCYSVSGTEKVMEYHTRVIDALIELPHQSSVQTIELLSIRGMTFHEFNTVLFDLTIKEADFGKYPALRCLFLSSNKERRERVIYSLTKDWHGYQRLLAQMLQPFHFELFQFLFSDES